MFINLIDRFFLFLFLLQILVILNSIVWIDPVLSPLGKEEVEEESNSYDDDGHLKNPVEW